jgi:hypothetical protein
MVRETCNGAKFDIKYGQMEVVKDWQRSLDINLAFNVISGLTISKFDIHECTAESLSRYHVCYLRFFDLCIILIIDERGTRTIDVLIENSLNSHLCS